jgi:hypothetical protein
MAKRDGLESTPDSAAPQQQCKSLPGRWMAHSSLSKSPYILAPESLQPSRQLKRPAQTRYPRLRTKLPGPASPSHHQALETAKNNAQPADGAMVDEQSQLFGCPGQARRGIN